MPQKIGFIGLGDIGIPMAKRGVTHGYEAFVCSHVRQEPVEGIKKLGATEGRTAKAVAPASDVIITMLRDDVHTGELVLGNGGVVEGAKEGSAIVMMST